MSLRPAVLGITLLMALSGGVAGAQATAGAKAVSPVDAVYAQAGRSLIKLGVYHVKSTTTMTVGTSTVVSTDEAWVDASQGLARTFEVYNVHAKGSAKKYNTSRELLVGKVLWSNGGPASPITCHHAAATVGLVLGCPFSDVQDASTISEGTYHGRNVLVLSVPTPDYGESATNEATTLTYLDPTTALPLAGTETGTSRSQKTVKTHGTITYHSERVARASLPKAFFSPAALGWKAPDPLVGLPHGIPLYWPGRTWAPGGKLPALTLQTVQRLTPSPMPFYQEILEYALASDPYGPPVLSIQVWTAADWAATTVDEPIPLCKPVAVVHTHFGNVTFRCPGGVDGPAGDLDPPGAHLIIDAPSAEDGPTLTLSPYGTVAALTKVVNALHVRA